MKLLPKSHTNSKGFTLIEILIVIVIIGILAALILAAINPIDQIKKANDVSKKSDSAELLNALERFYATFLYYPTCGGGYIGPCQITSSPTLVSSALLDEIVAKGEVKTEFKNKNTLASLYISQTASNETHVCFEPESKSFQAQAVVSSFCPNAGTPCICIPEQN